MTGTEDQQDRHGTVRGYFGDHCRCDRCKAAQQAHTKGMTTEGQRRLLEILIELKREGCICPLDVDHGLKGELLPHCPVHSRLAARRMQGPVRVTNEQKVDLTWALYEALVGIFAHGEHEATAEAEELRDLVVAWVARSFPPGQEG